MAGRKAYIPTDDDVATVRTMASAGDRNASIADALRISIPTLQKKFGALLREIRAGAPAPQLDLSGGAAVQPVRTPLPKAKSPGRKRYEPTDADRRRVSLLLADNQRKDLIARLLEISLPTFEKAFAEELEMAAISLIAKNLERLDRAAAAGKVAAMKHLQDRLDNAAAARASAGAADTPVKAEKAKDETPGKKAAAGRHAADVVANGVLGDLTRPLRPQRPN